MGTRGLFVGGKVAKGVQLTIHLTNVQVNKTCGAAKHLLPLYTLMNTQGTLYLYPRAKLKAQNIRHDSLHLLHFLLLAGDCATVAGAGVARFWAVFNCAIFSASDFRS